MSVVVKLERPAPAGVRVGQVVKSPDGVRGVLVGLSGGWASIDHGGGCYSQCPAGEVRR